jgi:hypothetical protein
MTRTKASKALCVLLSESCTVLALEHGRKGGALERKRRRANGRTVAA